MLRKNTKHQQPALISAISDLPEKQRKRLENSWAGTFYREFFCRIDESAFAVLYSEVDSRPNVPVGLEALKAGFGWSDQELNRLTICSSCWASPSPRSHLGTKRHARRGWEQHLSACVHAQAEPAGRLKVHPLTAAGALLRMRLHGCREV